ncbi:cation:proton antiporter [Uliginosibacterium sp. 31-16]|uniref:cation:proton antiporter n=1 Tax=Uliginosibacterium sp. 31-16 TaxID=3068315 RepID=UPI0027400417|nr:cation:proton antiporter [Uliginosibacterium sp. 31-16]MDP5237958.1 cation:proton antiporter [Uliginosibacterium sp. 31-16]
MASLLDLHFWPDWPLALDPLACFGLILFLAIALGELAKRLHLPRISAYIATGVLLSFARSEPTLTGLLPAAHVVFELAFALILFELGQRIDLGWLRRNPWLLASSLAESLLAFLAVGALMLLFDQPLILAVMIAALAASTGPAVVLGVTRDSTSRGQVTDRLCLLSALSSCYGFVVLGVAYAWQHSETAAPLATALLHPLYLIAGSAALGGLTAWLVLRLLARIRPGNYSQPLAAVGLIIIAVALAKTLELSVVISLLFAGILSRSLDRQHRLQPMDFGLLSRLALIVVFVATGSLLEPSQFVAALLPAVGLLAARALGKGIGVFLFARPSGLSLRKASLLTIGLLPMSGAALLWVERTAAIWPELGAQLAAIVLTALLIMEFLAPPALQFALRRANETGDTQ